MPVVMKRATMLEVQGRHEECFERDLQDVARDQKPRGNAMILSGIKYSQRKEREGKGKVK